MVTVFVKLMSTTVRDPGKDMSRYHLGCGADILNGYFIFNNKHELYAFKYFENISRWMNHFPTHLVPFGIEFVR